MTIAQDFLDDLHTLRERGISIDRDKELTFAYDLCISASFVFEDGSKLIFTRPKIKLGEDEI